MDRRNRASFTHDPARAGSLTCHSNNAIVWADMGWTVETLNATVDKEPDETL